MTGFRTRLTEIAPGIRRLVAPNPSMMTGPGTNSYLVGEREVAVIDPGPAMDRHIRNLVDSAPGPIRWILATHTHPDHSPAVSPLAAQTGAEVLGRPAPSGPHQDQTFRPERVMNDGDRLETEEFVIEALHTPGHASNHLCFHHRAAGMLFTGDHVINGSTVVINPPDGDMAAYLASLARLQALGFKALAPGHGEVIDQPDQAFGGLIEHRLKRESRVNAALIANPGVTSLDLVPPVYPEIPEQIHALAERSLLAHLLKLENDGQARSDGTHWWPTSGSDRP
ncbi:MAG: MBL fold metallo-hydrolase [Xanthomonadales bacterium]|nr:MBL fold metallo-hydrolase [Xanthomonadales bacterium]